MKLLEIVFGTARSEWMIKELNLLAASVSELFLRNLSKDFLANKPNKIVIKPTNEYSNQSLATSNGVLVSELLFNFEKYKELNTEFDQRLMILNGIADGFKILCEHFGWDYELVKNCYQKCLDQNIENQCYMRSQKFSPNRKYKAAIYCIHGANDYNVFADFFDNKGGFLKRELLTSTKPHRMYFYDVLGRTKWEKNDTFCLISRKGIKRWCAKID